MNDEARKEAIEWLMSIAANRQRGGNPRPWNLLDVPQGDTFDLANRAYEAANLRDGHPSEQPNAHSYAAAASLLHAGWSP